MNRKYIRYLFVIISLFFIGIIPVSAKENCTSVKSEMDKYDTYVKTLETLDCTNNSDSDNVVSCNDYNMRKNLIVTDLMKRNEEKSICSNEKNQVKKIIKENEDKCGQIFDSTFNNFVNKVMLIFYIAGPILLILFGSLDFAKATVSSEADALKKATTRFAKRLAATILLFLAPVLVNIVISFNVSDKYLSGNAYACDYKYLVYTKTYNIKYVPKSNGKGNIKNNTTGTAGTRNGDYILYNQCDSSWGSERLINSSSYNLCRAGCAVTAVSMQIVNSGVVDEDSFSPKVLNDWLRKNTSTGGNISWGAVSYGTNGKFKYHTRKDISGSLTSKAPIFQEYLSQGLLPVIQVKVNPNSHYVAIFEVNGTSVIAGDPATGELITLNNSKYPIATQSLTTQVELFTVER